MRVRIASTKQAISVIAAHDAAQALREAISAQGTARLTLASAASQLDMLAELVCAPELDWSRVAMFHLDEYIGMAADHPASFRRFLRERFLAHVPSLAASHFIEGDAPDTGAEIARVSRLVGEAAVDVACIGIGENGHLAFNDPPADFETDEPFIPVELDEACRRQQLGEGWFPTLDDVPRRAISMSIRQILRSRRLVVVVPDGRKAVAVRDAVAGPLTNEVPASILRVHPSCTLYLDEAAASLLPGEVLWAAREAGGW